MDSLEVRKLFIEFFKKRGHSIIPSSSLIPYDDPTVLLTTAGMQQFKKYYTGEKDAKKDFGTYRTASIQKCFRTTDIEEIGDERHLTFFEMLGNFSFCYTPSIQEDPSLTDTAPYFKKSAIFWAKEFLENVLGLRIQYVSVFKGENEIPFDKESFEIWKSLGVSEDKIMKFGKDDNFWGPTGDEGPCGPTTEIYIDEIEIWNLVFNEYYKEKSGKLKKLNYLGVDTGMGFERLMKVIQRTPSIFETDLFEPLRSRLLELLPELEKNTRHLRIILDHLRGAVFLIADGLYPSNLERGYVLRRILRRLGLKFIQNGIKLEWIGKFIDAIVEKFSEIYPELKNKEKIEKVAMEEMKKFQNTLERALKVFDKLIKENDTAEVLGEKLFHLFTTYGLPLEISLELIKERGLSWSERGLEVFNKLFEEHRKISKSLTK